MKLDIKDGWILCMVENEDNGVISVDGLVNEVRRKQRQTFWMNVGGGIAVIIMGVLYGAVLYSYVR